MRGTVRFGREDLLDKDGDALVTKGYPLPIDISADVFNSL
jgi:hypothetical protein